MADLTVVHQLRAVATCPVDQTLDVYDVTIETGRVIPVETILETVAALADREIFQEDLTVYLAKELRCTVTTVGTHSGVRTTAKATYAVSRHKPKGA